MMSEETNLKQRSSTRVIYRFLGGAALGALVVMIPISYGSPTDLSLVQIMIASLMVLTCGVLSSLWSEKFIDAVLQSLNAFSP
jgi:ribosome biogenesis protein Tsr3